MDLREAKEILNENGYELLDEGLWQKFKDKINEFGSKFDILVRKEILGSSSPEAEEGKDAFDFRAKRRKFEQLFCQLGSQYCGVTGKEFIERYAKAVDDKNLAKALAAACVDYIKGNENITPAVKAIAPKVYNFKTTWENIKDDLELLNLSTSIG